MSDGPALCKQFTFPSVGTAPSRRWTPLICDKYSAFAAFNSHFSELCVCVKRTQLWEAALYDVTKGAAHIPEVRGYAPSQVLSETP